MPPGRAKAQQVQRHLRPPQPADPPERLPMAHGAQGSFPHPRFTNLGTGKPKLPSAFTAAEPSPAGSHHRASPAGKVPLFAKIRTQIELRLKHFPSSRAAAIGSSLGERLVMCRTSQQSANATERVCASAGTWAGHGELGMGMTSWAWAWTWRAGHRHSELGMGTASWVWTWRAGHGHGELGTASRAWAWQGGNGLGKLGMGMASSAWAQRAGHGHGELGTGTTSSKQAR